MPNPAPARYRDPTGAWHTVETRHRPDGGWDVLDVTATNRSLIETLTGVGEGPQAAQALARDYATQRHHPPRGPDRLGFAA